MTDFVATPLGGALIALLLGLLVGLERQRPQPGEEPHFAGIRTFPVLALLGYVAATAGQHGAPLALPAVLLGVGGLAIAAYLRSSGPQPGATTESVALLAPLIGALVCWGEALLAASVALSVTLLLTLKAPLHRLAGSVSEPEILAVLKFGVVGAVVVPLLPAEAIGPYGAVVPRHVGLVVLILCGVSLAGYLLVRLVGGRAGWTLAGVLGGLVSSTAVTLSFSHRARISPNLAGPLAPGVILASTVLYARGLLLLFVFDQPVGRAAAPALLGLLTLGAVFALQRWRRESAPGGEAVPLGNPLELSHAVGLGFVFALVLVVARAAQEWLGAQGLFAAGVAGGLLDVDSVAVAVARLRQQGLAAPADAAAAFLLATLANLAVKSTLVAGVGGRELARRVLPAFAVLGVATLAAFLMFARG